MSRKIQSISRTKIEGPETYDLINLLNDEVMTILESLIKNGKIFMAFQVYVKAFNCSLETAVNAVQELREYYTS